MFFSTEHKIYMIEAYFAYFGTREVVNLVK